LALSLERLEHLCGRPLQRIGFSAAQRPLEEVARFLGGATPVSAGHPARRGSSAASEVNPVAYRPVTLVDTGERKRLELTVEVPVEDMARVGDLQPALGGTASEGPGRTSIWAAIHPRLIELIRAHRSTLLFVNSRRLAERLAGALNDVAAEPAGPVVEEQLKASALRGLVATSSLELGTDMGAIDLVIEIEAPPSVASGLQRIGRASGGRHQPGDHLSEVPGRPAGLRRLPARHARRTYRTGPLSAPAA